MPKLLKSRWYRHAKSKKDAVDVIPTEDREVTASIYCQYILVESPGAAGKERNGADE
jgi:hypothetical protein